MGMAGGVMEVLCDSPRPLTLQQPPRNASLVRELVLAGRACDGGRPPSHPSPGRAGRVPWDAAPILAPILSLATSYLSPSVSPGFCNMK